MPVDTCYRPIEDHGVIGDMHSVALVGMDGAIDFMCFPWFDSPTLFASLLDRVRGGRFQVAPVLDGARPRQLYLPDTNVLLTRFLSDDGVAELSDFMPIEEGEGVPNLVRRVKTVRGEVRYRMVCAPRFDYGRARHRAELRGRDVIFVPEGPHAALRLRSSVPVTLVEGDAVAEFSLGANHTAAFVLEEALEGAAAPSDAEDFVSATFKDTVNHWRRWLARCSYRGRWWETVARSALTLKLLTSQRHGSLVASPTFGLPEQVGGVRNWDYRYTWIRDASFTLSVLLRLGFTDEARDFMRWLEARCGELAPDGSLQIMYGLDGRHDLPEGELTHLEGYRASRPVRIGNNAVDQLQLDIYGELMDAVYLYNRHGEGISHDLWVNLVRLMNWLCANWRREDEGIWEVRGGRKEFLCSRLMCWVALDRAVRLATERSFPAPLARWLGVRDEIYHNIHEAFWSGERRAFAQFAGARVTDASALLMPLTGFVGPRDPRWLATLRAIEEDLVDDSLVRRYRHDVAAYDGLAGTEGTFNMCSFWYVECLARAGDVDQARFNFEKMLGYANHLGLYAEELGPRGEHLGNFPQALTHLALIRGALVLDERLSAAGRGV